MGRIKALTIRFKNELRREEIQLFRGAIIHATEQASLLFHNHKEDNSLRYAYPLIQYKRINQKAAIVCLGEGTEAIGQFFSSCNFDIMLGERPTRLEVESIRAQQPLIQIWDREFAYHIRRWLPLNQENYAVYCQEESLVRRYAMLERLLTANILSFAKGVGVHLEGEIVTRITQIDEPKTQYYKGVRLLSFDAEFKTNVSLPDYIGLGKGVSLGMGTVVRKYERSVVDESASSLQPEKVFLLGGHDLEMQTIKKIVEQQTDYLVVDKELRWDNARLSAYKEEIELYQGKEVYGVELREDFDLPEEVEKHYHRIDHHNDMSSLPSSLEQVATVLGVELTRFQKLVAANDSGYIPAMRALQATDEEVTKIRCLDRAAQGVTEEDEQLAEESVKKAKGSPDNLIVVKSLTSKFSAICDRIYPYKRLLIYTDSEWLFYGEGKSELVHQFSTEIQQQKVFHGGGERGFIGCARGAYNEIEIEQIINQIIERHDA